MRFSTIAVKLRLVMSKINKKNKIDLKYLPANFIFLKVVVSNMRNASGTSYFIP